MKINKEEIVKYNFSLTDEESTALMTVGFILSDLREFVGKDVMYTNNGHRISSKNISRALDLVDNIRFSKYFTEEMTNGKEV